MQCGSIQWISNIDMIALVLQHLLELTSVEKVENVLPVYSKEMAATIFSLHLALPQKHAQQDLHSKNYHKQ